MKQLLLLILAMILSSTFAFAQERHVNQGQFDDEINIIIDGNQIEKRCKQHDNFKTSSVNTEDFEGDLFPPYGWSVINGGDDSTFIKFPRGVRTGTGCAMIWYTEDAHDDYLITPQLAISQDDYTVSAWFQSHVPSFPEPYDVMVSTTGTDPEDFELFLAEPDPGPLYVQKFYDFSDYIGQNIYVAFRSTTTFQYALYIDDFTLPAIHFPFEHDLAVTDILPKSIKFDGFVPKVQISNFGNAEETQYSVTLSDGLSYSETVDITDIIASAGEVIVEFPEYVPEDQMTSVFSASITVNGDENSENDNLSKEIYIYDPIFEQHEYVNGVGIHSTGADVSMLESTQTGLGKGFNYRQQFMLADEFTIPSGQTWTVNGFRFFGYQTGSTLLSTLYGAYIKIYNGHPDLGGYIIADFGDENLLVSSSFSNAYREETGDITTTTRPIMELICKIPDLTLEAGEYWVSVGAMGSLGVPNAPQIGPYMVHLQLANGNTTTGNAVRVFMSSIMDWIDDGYQGMPFDVFGSVAGGTTGFENSSLHEQKIFASPNPSTGKFNINIDGYYNVVVSDISGRVVTTTEITPGNSTIDLTQYNPGIYFICISGEENHNLKVIVE